METSDRAIENPNFSIGIHSVHSFSDLSTTRTAQPPGLYLAVYCVPIRGCSTLTVQEQYMASVADHFWRRTLSINSLMPSQTICTPRHSRIKADKRKKITLPASPKGLSKRWA